MGFKLLGWPEDKVTLELDYRAFPYAGKFVLPQTGKAVIRENGKIIAAASFSANRTDETELWIRYLSVRHDAQGSGHGANLCRGIINHAIAQGYATVTIAVNNPYAYETAYRAGMAFTGQETGIAELVLSTDCERSLDRYQDGLSRFADRDGIDEAFIAEKHARGPPTVIERP